MKNILRIADLEFWTQRLLGDYVNAIRKAPADEFQARVSSPEVRAILDAMMTTRPKKMKELNGRKVVRWTREKSGRNWAFHAELCDGSLLHMGVSDRHIREFWHAWFAREAEAGPEDGSPRDP